MNAAETAALERLEDRLFGDDGEGGAVGTIRDELRSGFATMDSRVSAIETRHAIVGAITDERRVVKTRITAEHRWRIGLAIGVGTSVVLSLVNLLFAR